MKQAIKQCYLLTLSLFFFFPLLGSSVSINHSTRTVDWTDGTEEWQYFFATGNWSWNNGSNSWTYTASTSSWKDAAADDWWIYDATYDLWLSSTDGSTDVTGTTTFPHHAWRYVADTKRWHSVIRTEGSAVSFATEGSAYWAFNPANKRWTFTRTAATDDGGRTFANVILSQEWSFATDSSLRWEQQSPSAGEQWDYNRSNTTWISRGPDPDQVWSFFESKNNASAWLIASDPLEFGSPTGDSVRREWQYPFANGAWQTQEINSVGGIELQRYYAYNSTEHKWYYDENSDGIPDAEDGSNPGRFVFPHLPPTPFAPHKMIIDDVVNTFLDEGPTIGSTDGTGAGAIDAASHPYLTNGRFTFEDITKLNFVDQVTLDGDLVLHATVDASVTFKLKDTTGTMSFQPAAGVDHAQIVFEVDADKTLDIWIKDDVAFKALDDIPLFVSFRGEGTIRFRLRSGKTLSFIPNDAVNGNQGVRLQLLMEQTKADIEARKHQLIFAPWSYAAETGGSAVNTNLSQTSFIVLGRHSYLAYVSQNAAGVNEDSLAGYGSIAFDVAHEGVGRIVLRLMRGAVLGDQTDAGVNVYGTLITGSGTGGSVQSADFRTGVSKNKLAGIRAILKITDDTARESIIPDMSAVTNAQATAWVARGATDRRGLVVVNHCGTYPKLLANLRGDSTLQTSLWAQHSRPYYPGFILGKNGQIDIWHNLFLDYVGASSNQVIEDGTYLGSTDADAATKTTYLAGASKTTADVKLRNPSALIIDGMGTYAASANPSVWDMAYAGTVDPLITLRGTSGLFARCGAKRDTGAVSEADIIQEAAGGSGPDTLNATIGEGTYDGVFAPTASTSGLFSASESIKIDAKGNPVLTEGSTVRCLDGEHAIIFEGPAMIKSIMGPFGEAPNGYINIPSIRLDHTGKEITSG